MNKKILFKIGIITGIVVIYSFYQKSKLFNRKDNETVYVFLDDGNCVNSKYCNIVSKKLKNNDF